MTEDQDRHQTLRKDFGILKGITTDLIHENAELKNELDEKERELNLLYKVLREITYSMDWNEIQQTLLEIIMDFFPVVHFCLIALFDDKGQGIRVKIKHRHKQGLEVEFLSLPFEINEDTMWDEVVASDEWSEYFHKLDLRRSLQTSFIPLQLKNRELGFLMVGKPADVEYGKGEWRFLSTITNHLAITLENAELYYFATTDQLTGLFNRRYMFHRLEREVERAMRRGDSFSLLMIDIDHFKLVNDTYGHQSGDVVLKDLAGRVKERVGDGGIVCRYGGEEYVVALFGADLSQGSATAEEIRKIVGDTPFRVTSNGKEIDKEITISIGVAAYPKDSKTIKKLISKSDQALYLAKAQGRNRVVSHK